MEKPNFPAAFAALICFSLVTSMAYAEKPARKQFGKGHPFQVEELPAGKLKAKLQTLDPQARGKAMKWLHDLSFQEFDAAEHLRVDKDGGIYIVCPDGHGNCDGKQHKHHEKEAPAVEISNTEPIEADITKATEPPVVANAAVPVATPPAYNSKPGATKHIYLDFNGALVSGKSWSETDGVTVWTSWDCAAWSSDGDATTFSDAEQADMRRVWERIAEDYAPFDVNVTTDVAYDSVTYAGNKNNVGWLLFTNTTDKLGARCPHYGSGGVAYVGVYGNSNFFSNYQPAWVTPSSASNMAEAASHEMGHNMGLSHDGTAVGGLAYYGGHAATASAPSWGPIMGTGYGRNVSQWSKTSEYYDGNQAQDDLSIIAARVPYRADDHGDTNGTATSWLSNPVNQQGIVENTGDPDVFTFNTGAGSISFSANTYRCDTSTWGGNLDVTLELYNEAQALVASNNPAADVNATISYSAPAGRYYLVVKPSVTTGSPLTASPSGYTNYGSLGKYTITGNFIPEDDIFLSSPGGGESWILGASHEITWGSAMGGNVKIELLKADVLHSTIIASTPNDGSHTWDIPSGLTAASDYKVRITSVETPGKTHQSLSNFSIITDTLGVALDTVGRLWTTSGNLPWFAQTTTTHDGVDAAQSGAITHDQISSVETTIVGAGTMTFWWKVTSESGFDFLSLYLNDVLQTGANVRISGTVNWVQRTLVIPAGTNTVKWTYSKDNSVSTGADAGWVDEVVFTPTAQPEIAVEQPVGTDLTDGVSTANFGSVNTGSNASLTFTIKNVGTANLTGIVPSISGTNSADYTVTTTPATSLAAGTNTTCVIRFAPGAAGTRTALLQIASNDADENPFDINLTGNGVGPGSLAVTPAGGLSSSGAYGGAFSPSSLQYTLSNPGNSSINWTASKTQSWVTLSATSGTLAAGTNTTVTASINSGANTLNVGGYSDTVTFTNTTNASGNTTRAVALTVNPIPVTVTLGNLNQTYDGNPKSASVITNPTPVSYTVTYNGSTTAPTNAGTYAVVATVTQANYQGSDSGNLVIAYNVSYLGNGNTSGTAPADQPKFQGVDLNLATNSGNLNKTGFSFVGWNTAADGSGTDYAAGAIYSGNASLTLYAKWAPGADGTWIQTTAGPFDWGTDGNWSGGTVAAGADRTAFFTPNITAAQVVNLESARTIGNITFTDSTSASHDLTISGANILSLTRTSGMPTIDVTNRTLTISSQISGNNGLQKSGAGILTLAGNNNYSGGTALSAGQLSITSDANLGDSTGGITFNGNATLRMDATGLVIGAGRTITINGVTATFSSNNNGKTFQGVLEGTGELIASNTTSFSFTNTANTYTGDFSSRTGGATGYGLELASIGDGVGAGLIKLGNAGTSGTLRWIKASGGTATLANRQIALSGTTATGTIVALGGTSAENLIISKDLLISGTGNKKLLLAGTNMGTNTFAGNISDGTGSVITVEKTEGGIWALGGTNTYSGITNLVASATTGRLILQGSQSLSPNTTIAFNQNSSNVQSVSYLDDGVGPNDFARPITYSGSNTTQGMNIFVGNNNTANGGSSAGTTTGSIIQVGDITWNNAGQAGNTTRTFNLTGANGYALKTGNFILPNISNRTAGATWTNVLNPTTASLTIGGNITMASGNTVNGGIPVLELGGTAAGNTVTGFISDAADVGTTLRPLSVTKTGTGDWTLFGTNTYTGNTTISGTGKLFINGSTANTTLSVASGSTLGGTGTLGGDATIAAGGKLEFDISTAPGSHNSLDFVAGRTLTFSGASTLTITSSGGAAIGQYTLVTGGNNIVGSVPATLNLPSGWAATVSISGNSLLLNVTSTGGVGPLDHFAISTISSPQTAGTPITGITITAQDASNNTVTSFTGTVTFGGTGGFSGTSAAFVAGVRSGVSVTPTVAGSNLTFTVDNGAGSTGSANIATINPGAVASFAISAISGTQTVGTAITGITITAQDASNNTATGFTGTVTFGGTGGFSGTSAAFVAGVRSGVSVTPTVAGSNLTFTVDNGAGSTGSANIATIQTQYAAWAGGGSFDLDGNGDGIANGLAWVLGAANPSANATGLLPTVSVNSGNMIFTFARNQASINANTAVTIEVGTQLDGWPTSYTVGSNTAGSTAGVTVTKDTPVAGTDTITLSVPQSSDTKKFARLKVLQSP